MTICVSKSIMKMTSMLVSVGMIGGLSACATTSVSKIEEAAPVSYRIGQGDSSYASIRTPAPAPSAATGLPHTAPSTSPLSLPRQVPQPSPQPVAEQQISAPAIDLQNFDRGLYDHMKVGKPYKVAGQTYYPQHNPDYDKIGVASWYGDKFHGKPTANGEVYDKMAFTAAHKTLPLNSYVYVTNLDNGQSIKVRLNDRGPFIDGRIIDLSEAAAAHLGIRQQGTGRVRVQYAGAASADAGERFQQSTPSQLSERAPQPAPQPAPELKPQPQTIAETPAPQPMPYEPLRIGGSSTPTPQTVAQQQPSPVYEVPNIMGPTSNDGFGIALPGRSADSYQNQVPIPQPIPESGDEGVVTLTIKGPVHMAKTTTDNQGQPEVIPASYEEEK